MVRPDSPYSAAPPLPYDPAGNRTANTSASGFAIGPDNRLLADAAYSYQYDDEGNRTRQTLLADNSYRTFIWDYRNRLTSVRNYAANNTLIQVVDYLYDAFDRRVGREVDDDGDGLYDTLERYVWQGDQVVADFLDPDGPSPDGPAPFALAHRYLYGPAVDQLLAQEDLSQPYSSADRVLWPLSDNQHTTRDLVDNAGDPAGHFTYDAFGGLVAGDTSKTNVLYTGRELDPHTGLQYNRHRWYDPATGTFVSQDPIGFTGGDYNLGRYTGNGPTNATDPSGEVPWNRAAKWLAERGLRQSVHIHHIVVQQLFDDPTYAKWLSRLGVDRDATENLILLPTKAGRLVGIGGTRASHTGRHLGEYVKQLATTIKDIKRMHLSGELTDDGARAAIKALQLDLRKGLREGTLSLQKADRESLENGIALSILGVATISVEDELERAHIDGTEAASALTATGHTGEEGVWGWLGWTIDLFNPVSDAIFIQDTRHQWGLDKYDAEPFRDGNAPFSWGP